MSTYTRTHVETVLADPYLRCNQCKGWVTGWHNDKLCGCDNGEWQNYPCEHEAGAHTVCPSWSPVDGCTCDPVDHPVPPADVIGDKRS